VNKAFFRSVNRVTSEMEEILRRDHPWQAQVIEELREAVRAGNLPEAERRFACGDLWGGAGSVCDVDYGDPEMNARACKLLIDLVECFAHEGITYPRATEMAAIYKKWLGDGVFRTRH
jgi:hypothetical protein